MENMVEEVVDSEKRAKSHHRVEQCKLIHALLVGEEKLLECHQTGTGRHGQSIGKANETLGRFPAKITPTRGILQHKKRWWESTHPLDGRREPAVADGVVSENGGCKLVPCDES